jgi:glycosyltransferase involved in cell wall biosynthesis
MAWGGQEIRILQEAVAFAQKGHMLSLLAQPGSEIIDQAEKAGIKVFAMRLRNALDLSAISKIVRLIRREKFQIINTHSSVDSWVVSLAAKWARAPLLIRTRHISAPVSRNPLNFVWRMPDVILTTGEEIRENLIRSNRLNPRKIYSVPTGVSLARFSPGGRDEALKKNLGIDGLGPIITMVGLLRAQKRHEIFLDALKETQKHFPKVIGLIVGEGPRRDLIEKAVRERDLTDRVIITGHRDDIPNILSITDIGVLTSEAEGLPQVILQYLAMNLPVVATRVGAIPQVVIHGQTGLLVEPNDAAGLTECLLDLLNHPERAMEMAGAGRQKVIHEFSEEAMLNRIMAIYQEALSRKYSSRGWTE